MKTVEFGVALYGLILGDSGRVWRDQGNSQYAYLSVNSISFKYVST
jgi:hypothetical protein